MKRRWPYQYNVTDVIPKPLSASGAPNIQFYLKYVYARGNGCQGLTFTPKGFLPPLFFLYLLRFSRYSQKTKKNKDNFPSLGRLVAFWGRLLMRVNLLREFQDDLGMFLVHLAPFREVLGTCMDI